MKKLKTLCAIVGTAAVLYGSAAFAEQKFKVPEYSLEGAEEKVSYIAITPFGKMPIDDPKDASGLPVVTYKKYFVDRNKDGKNDLVYIEIKVPEIENEGTKQPDYVVKQLFIDDNFNGYTERMLLDEYDENGNPGADGIFDQEQHASRIKDI